MNQRIKTIFADPQKLSPAEREELAELLLATIDPDLEIETITRNCFLSWRKRKRPPIPERPF